MSVVISGRRNLERFQLLQHIYALEIESKTGLRHSRGSVLNSAREKYGISARRKDKAIMQLRELLARWDDEDAGRDGR